MIVMVKDKFFMLGANAEFIRCFAPRSQVINQLMPIRDWKYIWLGWPRHGVFCRVGIIKRPSIGHYNDD